MTSFHKEFVDFFETVDLSVLELLDFIQVPLPGLLNMSSLFEIQLLTI